MNLSIREIQDVVRQAKEQVIASEVPPEEADVVSSTLAVLQLLERSGIQVDSGLSASSREVDMPETVAEWAAKYSLTNHYDRFVAAAVHLREKYKLISLTSEDILQVYKKARWDKPQNPADVFAKAAKRLLFAEVENSDESGDSKKRWMLTRTGYQHFQSLGKGSD